MTKQANSHSCFVCGVANPIGLHLKFYETSPGEVVVDTIVPPQYQGFPGIVHGGIIASMLDEVSARSLMVGGEPPRFMYTAKLEIHYRKNVPIGQPIRLVGRAGKRRRRVASATGSIYDTEGTLLAEAEAILIDVPAELVGDVDLNEIGWKVYPD